MSTHLTRRQTITALSRLAVASSLPTMGSAMRVQAQVTAPPASGTLVALSAGAAVHAMRRGDVSAEAYAAALLDRAERLPALNAFCTLDRPTVLESARRADLRRASGAPLGLLHGLPVPLKDSIGTSALPTSNGTASLRTWRPKRDAAVLDALTRLGAYAMGKTTLHELSFGWTSNNEAFGPVRNPYDTARVPGGSSGGSAAAVAAQMAPLALGEDTLGSIRVPASMCGVVGFRPTVDRYPNAGIMPLTQGRFDQVGPITRTVADVALFDAALTGRSQPVAAMPLQGVRIGLPVSMFERLDGEVERLVKAGSDRLRSAGAVVESVVLPPVLTEALDIAIALVNYEVLPAVSDFLRHEEAPIDFDRLMQEVSPGMRRVFEFLALPPNRPSNAQHQDALARLAPLRGELGKFFAARQLQAIAYPPILIPPPRIGDEGPFRIGWSSLPMYVVMARQTALASCARMPSIVLPVGLTSSGLPVGLEFAALPGGDEALLSMSLSIEDALGPIPLPKM